MNLGSAESDSHCRKPSMRAACFQVDAVATAGLSPATPFAVAEAESSVAKIPDAAAIAAGSFATLGSASATANGAAGGGATVATATTLEQGAPIDGLWQGVVPSTCPKFN